MKKISKKSLSRREIFPALFVVSLFIFGAFLMQKYGYLLEEITFLNGYKGVLFYIVITVIAVVIAPISTLPLLPLAVFRWGVFFAAFFSIIGWSIGSAIAFVLARRFGKPFIAKIISIKKIEEIENSIPKENFFISIVLLRIALPVDVLSYALGLFSSVSFKLFIFATIIGVAPFAFIFSYASALPIWLQGLLLLLSSVVLIGGYRRWHT